jgi:hypothetical protein
MTVLMSDVAWPLRLPFVLVLMIAVVGGLLVTSKSVFQQDPHFGGVILLSVGLGAPAAVLIVTLVVLCCKK